jgi:hypothetical protein
MTKLIKLYHYGHPRALFCCQACRIGLKNDRRAGLIYGPYWLKSLGRFARDAEEASAIDRFCPYCGAKEGAPNPGFEGRSGKSATANVG